MQITKTDLEAISRNDSDYLLDKGANFYNNEEYDLAKEYYHLAATLGNNQAMCNLGYCYLYRTNPINKDLALAYFKMAASKNNIDALYKLGTIYEKGDILEQDEDLAIYYYDQAIKQLNETSEDKYQYPSLYLKLAKLYMPEGKLSTNIERAYIYLNIAKEGFITELENGIKYNEKLLEQTEELLKNDIFSKYETD